MTNPQSPADIAAFIASLPERRAAEASTLDTLFREASGFAPTLSSGGILGYGNYDYTYESGRSGTCFATGFAPRKAKISVYIMPGYAEFGAILDRLGPHKMGKACLTFTRLERIDTDVLSELIRAGLQDLATRWTIRA